MQADSLATSEAPVDLPKSYGPRPGALSLLTAAQRGLTLAIIQAERCGRGGEDLEVLSGNFSADSDAAVQLNTRINMLSSWAPAATSSRSREGLGGLAYAN